MVFGVYIHKKRGRGIPVLGQRNFLLPIPNIPPLKGREFYNLWWSVVVFHYLSASAYVPVTPSSLDQLLAARAEDLATMLDIAEVVLSFAFA